MKIQQNVLYASVVAFLALLAALVGCGGGEPVPLTRSPAGGAPAVTAVEPEQPQPVATAQAPAPAARLDLGRSQPLHGEPPYEARFLATLAGNAAVDCTDLVWLFGDGVEARQPCMPTGPEGATWQVSHRYEERGTYHARVRLELADGTTLESEKTQAIVVASPQGPTLRATVIRWIGCVTLLLAVGAALIALAFLRGRRRLLGAGLLALFLITFVPPFSYAPDPLGIVVAALGGYRYDPRLPLANRFVMAGDPTEIVQPYLDGLIGATGLDPLDPVRAMTGYEFVKVVQRQYHTDVHVLFAYEDGTQRVYALPLRQPAGVLGFYACCWQYDGLGRLRTEHRALDPAPFAGDKSVRLGTPQRLPLPVVDGGNAQNWFGAASNPAQQRLVWSPQGDAFLAPAQVGAATALWLLTPGDGRATQVADNVWEYGWLPDGAGILYSTVAGTNGPERSIYRVGRDGSNARLLLSLPAGESAFPGISEAGLWYVQGGALWLLPRAELEPDATARPRRMAELPRLPAGSARPGPVQVSPAPDGARVAYTCGSALCLIDADGKNHVVAVSDARFVSLAWRPDGQQLAAAFWDYGERDRRPATLRLINRDGTMASDIAIAPSGPVDAPQWLPSGRALLLQSYPADGRRILFVDSAGKRVTDLSQPRWDAFFAVHPAGESLLLSNGRGGFWLAGIE